MSSIQIQYFMAYTMAAYIGDNKFLNCVFVGVGEVFACLITPCLVSRISDSIIFKLFAMTGFLANGLFYVVPVGFA